MFIYNGYKCVVTKLTKLHNVTENISLNICYVGEFSMQMP
jgi:hypothetical protein